MIAKNQPLYSLCLLATAIIMHTTFARTNDTPFSVVSDCGVASGKIVEFGKHRVERSPILLRRPVLYLEKVQKHFKKNA